MRFPVFMCGGAGTRLWPLSRKASPKQYLSLVGDQTLLQATASRLGTICHGTPVAGPIIICGAGQETIASEQLAEIGVEPTAIIVEPMPRNTAAVAAVASHFVEAESPGASIFLLAAAHHVEAPDGFWLAVGRGCPAARDGDSRKANIVALGAAAFQDAPSEPVDTAIMEKTHRATVVALSGSGWNDIGSWVALSDLVEEDTRGDVIALDCEDTMIRSDGPMVAAAGLEGMIVIATGDAVLILPKERSQDVKAIVARLMAGDLTDLL